MGLDQPEESAADSGNDVKPEVPAVTPPAPQPERPASRSPNQPNERKEARGEEAKAAIG